MCSSPITAKPLQIALQIGFPVEFSPLSMEGHTYDRVFGTNKNGIFSLEFDVELDEIN